ncbi:MAG: dockerin type I repeat-containing protein [Planctomycetota bacterium]
MGRDGRHDSPAGGCPNCPDINGDGVVDIADLLQILVQHGSDCEIVRCAADINCDGRVNVQDLLLILENWGVSDC